VIRAMSFTFLLVIAGYVTVIAAQQAWSGGRAAYGGVLLRHSPVTVRGFKSRSLLLEGSAEDGELVPKTRPG
jgi:hypothetical protein